MLKKILFTLMFTVTSSVYALNVTPLNSAKGGKMLSSSLAAGDAGAFLKEVRYFTYQQNVYFCSAATSVIILNTMGITPPQDANFGKYKLFTQNNLYTPEVVSKSGINESTVMGQGLKLAQETKLLNSYAGVQATAYDMESMTQAQSKKIILKALKTEDQYVIANISRADMDEVGGGHFSPIAAYDAKTDSFLFMDVASFKYGPTWVPYKSLYNGMHTKDGTTYRGFIVVSKATAT